MNFHSHLLLFLDRNFLITILPACMLTLFQSQIENSQTYHKYNAWEQFLIKIRCKRPSARCASATKPSGALSFRQEMTAAPTLRKRPLDLNHFDFIFPENGMLQTSQLARQIIFSLFLLRPWHDFLPPFKLSSLESGSDFLELISKYDISASYDLETIKKNCAISLRSKNTSMMWKAIERSCGFESRLSMLF